MRADVPRLVRAAAAVAMTAMMAAACATHGFVPPQGPSKPVPDADQAWSEAAGQCADVRAVQAQGRLSGRVGGQRVPGLIVGFIASRANEIGLEARLSGSALFVLAGRDGNATLVLPQDRRVVVAPASEILEALVGVEWEPARLMAVLAGCLVSDARAESAVEYGDGTLAVNLTGGDVAYLSMADGRRRIAAGRSGGLRVEYRRGPGPWPAEIRIASEPDRAPAVSLQLRLETVVGNPAIAPAAFAVSVPAGAEAMSIAQLRDGGPLGTSGRRP